MDFHNLGRLLAQLVVENFPRLIQAGMILLVTWVGLLALRGAFRRLNRQAESLGNPGRSMRMRTIYQASANTLAALVLLAAIFSLLALVGINLTPVLASVGVLGLAVSLGAQALIKDTISGFLILTENQYTVGEEVAIGEVRGVVERLTLRATWVREFSGRLYTLPNSEVRSVANASRDWMRAIVDLNFPYQADLRQVVALLQGVCEQVEKDETVQDVLMEPPQVAGWIAFTDWSVKVRLMAMTAPGKQYGVETALRRAAQQALEEASIATATPFGGLAG